MSDSLSDLSEWTMGEIESAMGVYLLFISQKGCYDSLWDERMRNNIHHNFVLIAEEGSKRGLRIPDMVMHNRNDG